MTRVILVFVEVAGDAGAVDALDAAASQWSQDLRYRALASGVETSAAAHVSLPGTLHTLADALRAAHDGLA